MKNVVLLGSTGSIGESALRVIASLPSRLRVTGLSVRRNYRRALEQARRFGVRHVAVADPESARQCAGEAPTDIRVFRGPEGVEDLVSAAEGDIVLCAVVGLAGLKPVLAAAAAGRDIALATKEVLVAAGRPVLEACARHGSRLLPVDSEHSAVFQCLEGARRTKGSGARPPGLRSIILTASGGPFAFRPEVDLDRVTVEEALRHPRWEMGKKVTVDSATLMNKGLEILEAHWLFDLPVPRIRVVLHPESIVHSMVEFEDGSVLAQLGEPDMRFAIQYALTYPERLDGGLPALDPARIGTLHFGEPDEKRFPCLALARRAAEEGGTMPAVLNAANEVAVEKFLTGRIGFSGIWRVVEKVTGRHQKVAEPDLDALIEADAWGRRAAEEG